ncbi:MAG: hypothetical protein PHG85_01480 [Candidatus Altiarchaeota archaeon]|nr:hypothetical protein [Candidatus Altiarchaeota archaeon]
MIESEFTNLGKWLSTTEQQFQVLSTIQVLENRETEIRPKAISKEYSKTYGKTIQKPNLFTILKALAEKNLIRKDNAGNYRVNYDGIRHTLARHREKIDNERTEFQKACENTEEYFKKHMLKAEHPMVGYYEHRALYAEMVKSLENASVLHVVANFPNIAYTYNIAAGIDRLEYVETLWKRCLKQKDLKIEYLTTLDIDYLFNQAFRVHGDPKLAYRECQAIINQLETQAKTNPKLDIRHSEEQPGLDIAIMEQKDPQEAYLFIRDEHGEITGGIRIKSRQIAANAMQQYARVYEYAEKLTTPEGQKKIQDLKIQLKQKYGLLG